MNITKSIDEINYQEFKQWLEQEEQKDNTIRKILTIEKLENVTDITEKNALKQFKNLMLGEYLLGSENEYILEADYFAGKGKNILWSITTVYSRYHYVSIDLSDVRQSINESVKQSLKDNPYYNVAENFNELFDQAYNNNLKKIKNKS